MNNDVIIGALKITTGKEDELSVDEKKARDIFLRKNCNGGSGDGVEDDVPTSGDEATHLSSVC